MHVAEGWVTMALLDRQPGTAGNSVSSISVQPNSPINHPLMGNGGTYGMTSWTGGRERLRECDRYPF